jgi:protease-4
MEYVFKGGYIVTPMKYIVVLLIVIVLITGCTEQLPQEPGIKEVDIPVPDYTALQEEYAKERQAITDSYEEKPFDGKIAVIRIEGILDSEDVMPIAAKLREVSADSTVNGVLLWIDSPGGSVAATIQIAYEVERLKVSKPVVAYTGGVSASGGYYIMSICDSIVVRPDAEVGSIGVIYVHIDASGYYSQFGFDIEVFKTGKHKDAGADWRDLTQEERQYITDSLYDAFYRFVYTVSRGRGLNTDYVEKYSDGMVWLGADAVELGFADILGNFDQAVTEIERLTGIQNAELVFIEINDSGEIEEFQWETVLYLHMGSQIG